MKSKKFFINELLTKLFTMYFFSMPAFSVYISVTANFGSKIKKNFRAIFFKLEKKICAKKGKCEWVNRDAFFSCNF